MRRMRTGLPHGYSGAGAQAGAEQRNTPAVRLPRGHRPAGNPAAVPLQGHRREHQRKGLVMATTLFIQRGDIAAWLAGTAATHTVYAPLRDKTGVRFHRSEERRVGK